MLSCKKPLKEILSDKGSSSSCPLELARRSCRQNKTLSRPIITQIICTYGNKHDRVQRRLSNNTSLSIIQIYYTSIQQQTTMDTQQIYILMWTIANFFSFSTLSFMIIAILWNKEVRERKFNMYLIFVSIFLVLRYCNGIPNTFIC